MHHQGYDLQYDDRGWRATFYTTGMEHSPTSATGTGWERTPWHATQRAAWETLRRVQPAWLRHDCLSGGAQRSRTVAGPAPGTFPWRSRGRGSAWFRLLGNRP